MKKLIFGTLALVALQSTAHAHNVMCNFTEPFITLSFDNNKGLLTRYDYGGTERTVAASSSLQGHIMTVTSADSTVKLVIDLSKKGNDGMSDREYDFDAVLNGKLYGGCDEIKD
ncbi:hypothetical protein D3C87_89830 [compost metagenome]